MAKLQKASKALQAGKAISLTDESRSVAEVFRDDVMPLKNRIFDLWLSSDIDKKLSVLYDDVMESDVLLQYDPIDRETIARTAFSVVGTLCLAGIPGLIGDLVQGTGFFFVDFYTNFFQYTAWVTMRYSWSGRYAERVWEYYFTMFE